MIRLRTAGLVLVLVIGMASGLVWPSHAQTVLPPAPRAPSWSTPPWNPAVWGATTAGFPVGTVTLQVPAIVNPAGVAFTASPDHSAVGGTPSVPLLTRYVLEILAAGTTTVLKSADLGKPTPDAAGDITFLGMLALRTAAPALPNGSYVGRVAAEGPGGRSLSANSDPFSVAPVLPAVPGVTGKPRWIQ